MWLLILWHQWRKRQDTDPTSLPGGDEIMTADLSSPRIAVAPRMPIEVLFLRS
jgi:hypothetical protein